MAAACDISHRELVSAATSCDAGQAGSRRRTEVIWARGGVPVLRVADAKEYRELLRSLLAHEARGVAAAGPDELADMLNVVGAITNVAFRHQSVRPRAIDADHGATAEG